MRISERFQVFPLWLFTLPFVFLLMKLASTTHIDSYTQNSFTNMFTRNITFGKLRLQSPLLIVTHWNTFWVICCLWPVAPWLCKVIRVSCGSGSWLPFWQRWIITGGWILAFIHNDADFWIFIAADIIYPLVTAASFTISIISNLSSALASLDCLIDYTKPTRSSAKPSMSLDIEFSSPSSQHVKDFLMQQKKLSDGDVQKAIIQFGATVN